MSNQNFTKSRPPSYGSTGSREIPRERNSQQLSTNSQDFDQLPFEERAARQHGVYISLPSFSDDEEDPSGLVTSDLHAIVNSNSTLAFASISPSEDNSVLSDIHPEKDSKESLKGSKKAQKLEKKIKRMMKKIEKLRKAFAAGASVGVILLVILLIAVCCAGICIALSGGGVGSVFLGLIILGLAIFGIIKLLNGSKKVKEPKQGNT